MKKEDLERIYKAKGMARGTVFQIDTQYIISKWGRAGLEKIKKKAKEWGYDIPYEGVDTMGWYPLGLRVISLLLIKEVFNLSDAKIREMGTVAPRFSFIFKFIFKLITPIKKFAEGVPRYWDEHYTAGKLEVKKLDENKKILVAHLKGIKIDPVFCVYLEGYFEGVCRFLFPTSTCKETKCMFNDEEVHEYTLTW